MTNAELIAILNKLPMHSEVLIPPFKLDDDGFYVGIKEIATNSDEIYIFPLR